MTLEIFFFQGLVLGDADGFAILFRRVVLNFDEILIFNDGGILVSEKVFYLEGFFLNIKFRLGLVTNK